MENSKKNRLRAGGIIFNKKNTHIVLVLNRESFLKKEYKYGLPKGHLQDHEKDLPHLGAQREILEEIGIFMPITKDTISISIYDTIYYVLTLDKLYNPTFQPYDTKEIILAEWVPINRLEYLNANRTLAKLIKKWNNIFYTETHLSN